MKQVSTIVAVSSHSPTGRILYPPTIRCINKSCSGFLNGCEKLLEKGKCAILLAVSMASDMEGRTIMRWSSVSNRAAARKALSTITIVSVPTDE